MAETKPQDEQKSESPSTTTSSSTTPIKNATTGTKRTLKEMQGSVSESEEELEQSQRHAKKRKLNPAAEPETEAETKEASDTDNAKQSKDAKQAAGSTFKICCYNLNGIRAAARKGLEDYINKEDADVVCFSEVKAKQIQNPCKFEGYQVIWNECTDKAGYAGSAILSKQEPLSVIKGIGECDGEGRAITVEYENFYVINTYVPNSGQNLKFKKRRIAWDEKMKQHLKALQDKKPIIWTGDLNVAILDFDVYDGETNKARCKTAGFTPYERESFGAMLKDLDAVDSYRELYPTEKEKHFTFFSTRGKGMKKANKGWRLDYFVMSTSLAKGVEDVEIRRDTACSDHVPLVLTFKQ